MNPPFRIRVDHVGNEVHIVIVCRDEYEAAVMHEDIATRLRTEHGVRIPLGLAVLDPSS